MQRYITIWRSSPFFRHNLTFFLGSLSVGALNYLYYPFVGRLMSPSAFGEVQTLISVYLQLTIFLNVLSLVVVNLMKDDKTKQATRIVTELQLAALWVAIGTVILAVVSASGLKEALHFSSELPFVLLALALVASVPFTFQTAYLRARKQFVATSTANAIVAGGKLILSVMLIVAGFGVSGAIGGLIAAQVIGLWYALSKMNWNAGAILETLRAHWWPSMSVVAGELRHVGYALVGLLSVMVLLSLDVVVVKYFFDAHTAGLYAGVATVARIIFFLTASIAQVLLPSVAIGAAQANWQLLRKSVLILSGLSLPVLALVLVAPTLVMDILMGGQYSAVASLLVPLAIAIFFVSTLNLFVSYCLALRWYKPIVLAAIGTVTTYAVMIVWHSTLGAVVTTLLIGSVATTGLVGLVVWSKSQEEQGEK